MIIDKRKGQKMNEKSVRLLEFNQHGDERGRLVIVEGNHDIPFDIKRIFYIYGSDNDLPRDIRQIEMVSIGDFRC